MIAPPQPAGPGAWSLGLEPTIMVMLPRVDFAGGLGKLHRRVKASWLEELLRRRLLMVTGKGGTGKSTVASALALLAARRGLRVLLDRKSVV